MYDMLACRCEGCYDDVPASSRCLIFYPEQFRVLKPIQHGNTVRRSNHWAIRTEMAERIGRLYDD